MARIHQREETKDTPQGLISRILGHWQQDPHFTTKNGKPRVLSLEGDDSEFKQLVRSITHDVTPGTVLFELERIEAVEHTRNGLKLTSRIYVPKGNLREGFSMLARDSVDLMEAIEYNLFEDPKTPNLHLNTEFDRISDKALPKIREWLIREGSALHQRARNFLSKYDADLNVELEPSTCNTRVKLGSFSVVATEDATLSEGES